MEPIRIKLTYWEVAPLRDYCYAASWKAKNPQAREELIVLVEHLPKVEQQLTAAGRRDRSKAYQYIMPISVARILHRRWQQERISAALQMVLNALDYELVQRGMRPDFGSLELF